MCRLSGGNSEPTIRNSAVSVCLRISAICTRLSERGGTAAAIISSIDNGPGRSRSISINLRNVRAVIGGCNHTIRLSWSSDLTIAPKTSALAKKNANLAVPMCPGIRASGQRHLENSVPEWFNLLSSTFRSCQSRLLGLWHHLSRTSFVHTSTVHR